MADNLEQVMKKIHIYIANSKESAYSSEDVIISKKRMFALLEELNYAVYEVMEQYEATASARDRGLAAAERMATDIKEDAMKRAEDVYASSLLYTQEAIADMRNALEYTYQKTKTEYQALIIDYEDKIEYLEENARQITAQLSAMSEAKTYLHLIEEIKARNANRSALDEELEQTSHSKNVGSVTSAEAVTQEQDEYESKLTTPIVVAVHETPKIPDGFGRGKGKKKGKKMVNEASMQSQDLDAEYFAFQEEQEKMLAEQMRDGADDFEEEDAVPQPPAFLKDALKKFSLKKK